VLKSKDDSKAKVFLADKSSVSSKLKVNTQKTFQNETTLKKSVRRCSAFKSLTDEDKTLYNKTIAELQNVAEEYQKMTPPERDAKRKEYGGIITKMQSGL